MKEKTEMAKALKTSELNIGDLLLLEVVFDAKGKEVFASQLSAGSGEYLRIVHPSCYLQKKIKKGEWWLAKMISTHIGKKTLIIKGRERQVVYYNVDCFTRLEIPTDFWIEIWQRKVVRNIMSGIILLGREEISATVKNHWMIFNGKIVNVQEVLVGEKVISKKIIGHFYEEAFAEDQRKILGRKFDLVSFKKRLPIFSVEICHEDFSWEQLHDFYKESLGLGAPSAKSLAALATLSTRHFDAKSRSVSSEPRRLHALA